MDYTKLFRRLGQRIEELRRERGLTQEELAEQADLHRAYFWDIEHGRNISVKTAHKIAKALGIDLAELFRDVK